MPIRTRPVASLILTAFSALFLLLACRSFHASFGAVLCWLCAVLFIGVAGNIIKRYLKKQGASRTLNRTITIGSVVFLTFLFLCLMAASIISGRLHFSERKTVVGTYELYGRTREIYNDPLPLEIEALADVSVQWSKEASHLETVLLSNTEYRQYAVPVDGNDRIDEGGLEYTVTEVKMNFLYDFIKQAMLNSRQDEIHDDFAFTDHYEPVEASVWNADDAYQLHWSGSILNTYLLCWENRIVEVKFYWEPTPEQIAISAKALGGSFSA